VWTGLDFTGQGQVESSCECDNEPSGFIRMLGNYQVASQLVASRVVLISIVSHLDVDPAHIFVCEMLAQ
jgi:hypothetical protein